MAMADCGADDVLNFLRYGAPLPDSFGQDAEATAAVIAPFRPALALAAHDSAAVDPRVLSALCHLDTPCALTYAGLDYGGSFLSLLNETLACAEGPSGSHTGDSTEHDAWAWYDEDEDEAVDECDAFQQGDEVMRMDCNDLGENLAVAAHEELRLQSLLKLSFRSWSSVPNCGSF